MPPYEATPGGTPKGTRTHPDVAWASRPWVWRGMGVSPMGLAWHGRLAHGFGVAWASRPWVWRGMGVPPMGLAWHGRLAHGFGVAWASRPCDYLLDCYRFSEDSLQALGLT
jgi:hypothetical protein